MSKEKVAARPLALSLVVLGTLSRLLPHPPNMTAVGAASLFSGARLRGGQALLVPLACMLVTDPILGFVYGFPPFSGVTPFIYAAFLLNVGLGRWLAPTTRPLRIGALALLGSLQFFLLTNFGVWLVGGGHPYPRTPAGLVACYVAALPFFAWTLVADLGYAAVLFGLHAWLSRRVFPAERVGVLAAE
ncbi:MAG: DUF6580 family putative transport protein [Terriglobales bacterium]